MQRRTIFTCLVALFLGAGVAQALEVGDIAPDFELQGHDGNVYRLSDFRGEQAVVVAWFPRAFTRGCTLECRSYAENGHLIREFDVAYFMASVDPVETNRAFAEENGADFPLLSDPGTETAAAFGVLNAGGVANRNTFYIGADGRILHIERQVQPASAAEDVVAKLTELNVARR